MNYLSVCSGIEAASVAWNDFNWNPIGFSEIEKFPSEVLKHHYPNVKNFGDMTKYKEWSLNGTVGLLVGGTPCQSFSVAGLRKGLEDPRGNLALTYVGILDRFKPKWFIWENVPGVLSSNGGRDFGSFLGAVAELGYGFAYRVLDAQYFGVPQRRKRVFVVGCFGNWRTAGKVLFEPESLRGNSPPSREKRKETTINSGIGIEISSPLAARRFSETDGLSEISGQMIAVSNVCGTLMARDYKGISADDTATKLVTYCNHLAPTLTSSGAGISRTGADTTADSQYIVQPISFDLAQITSKQNGTKVEPNLPVSTLLKGSQMHCAYTLNATEVHGVAILGGQHPNASIGENLSPTLTSAMGTGGGHVPVVKDVANVHAFKVRGGCDGGGKDYLEQDEKAFTLSTTQDQQILAPTLTTNDSSRSPRASEVTNQIASVYQSSMQVRRLTPIECERLQGFPDNYTNIKHNCPDGSRYKALGNSMAVPVMRWIGKRIKDIEELNL